MPTDANLSDFIDNNLTEIEPIAVSVPYDRLAEYYWRFNREQIGSNWQLNRETREWLETKGYPWRLQDSVFFRNNQEIQDDCNTRDDVYRVTKPTIVFYEEHHALMFRLHMS